VAEVSGVCFWTCEADDDEDDALSSAVVSWLKAPLAVIFGAVPAAEDEDDDEGAPTAAAAAAAATATAEELAEAEDEDAALAARRKDASEVNRPSSLRKGGKVKNKNSNMMRQSVGVSMIRSR
jgi:hypothetical protein